MKHPSMTLPAENAGRHCRIGRVRLKAGGELRIIDGGTLCPVADRLVSYAKQTAINEPDMHGFIVLAWDATGGYHISGIAPGDGAIPTALLPSWVSEVVRREFIARHDVRRIVDGEYKRL